MSDYIFSQDTLPTNDEEVRIAFKAMYQDDFTVRNMWGIYECERNLGKDVMAAYKSAIQTYVRLAEGKK